MKGTAPEIAVGFFITKIGIRETVSARSSFFMCYYYPALERSPTNEISVVEYYRSLIGQYLEEREVADWLTYLVISLRSTIWLVPLHNMTLSSGRTRAAWRSRSASYWRQISENKKYTGAIGGRK